ncbi:NADPH-dependent FMN reductase [Micromonospora zhanjiangensis]
MSRLAVVLGSARPGRFGPVVASWVTEQARRHRQVDIDLVDIDDHQAVDREAVAALGGRLAAADAFLFVVPEYNHSFPGELKTVIDRFTTEWARKPVGFVSYGGLAGGLRAVEQLRLVFIELLAVPVRDTVSFHGARSAFGPDGNPHQHEAARAALDQLLTQLAWWATALRTARRAQPA